MRAAGLLLAAGGSRRMGRPKQLLEWRGQSLVRRAAQVLVGSRCERVVAVVGAHGEQVGKSLAGLPIEIVQHPGWREGVGSSIRVGTAAIENLNDFEALVVALADQPHVVSDLIDALLAGIEGGASLAACTYEGIVGAPAAFGPAHFGSLRDLGGNRGAQAILRAHAKEVFGVPFPEGSVDIDTPESYERIRAWP